MEEQILVEGRIKRKNFLALFFGVFALILILIGMAITYNVYVDGETYVSRIKWHFIPINGEIDPNYAYTTDESYYVSHIEKYGSFFSYLKSYVTWNATGTSDSMFSFWLFCA